ncbi:MAG: restriction endonuclease subunit S [Azonexus sp.]|nr:restriction endonuclease subunit S [Azonexus sp.]
MRKVELPGNWIWATVADLGKIVSGGTPSTKEPSYWGGNVAWISPSDLTGYSTKHIAKGAKSITPKGLQSSSATIMPAGSIHFSSRAPIGYTVISACEMSTNQGFKSLVPASGVFNEYVFYYFKSAKQLAETLATGTTFKEISGAAFSKMPLPLPPTNEQHRIVAKIEELFSELDKGVDSLKTAREQLKVYRQALLKHAFEGKLTAQWRAENSDKLETASALQQRIQTERQERHRQQLADWETKGKQGSKPKDPKPLPPLSAEELAELPKLPTVWGWVKYGDLCSLVRNGISAKPEGNSGTPIFRISAVRPLFFDMTDIRHIENSTGAFNSYCLERGDIVFTRYNGSRHYVGVCAEYRSDEKRLFPDKLVQTRTFSKLMSTSYLEKALNSGPSRQFVESKIRTTAGQSGVSGEDIKNIPVPICSPAEQRQIIEELESKLSEADQLDQTLATALQQSAALRQSILKNAFCGQLVKQDENDEPAAVLLERIRAEKLNGMKPGKREKTS